MGGSDSCGFAASQRPVRPRVRPVNALRLLILTPRFWPQSNGSQRLLARLVAGLAQRGCRPTIVTVRWGPAWPVEVSFHELLVVRLLSAPGKSWSRLRSARALSRWLGHPGEGYHAAYVWDGLDLEVIRAGARVAGGRMPVVLRAGSQADSEWVAADEHARRPGGSPTADRVAVPSESAWRRCQAAGWAPARMDRVVEGAACPAERTRPTRSAARRTLAEADAALQVPEVTPLVVGIGEFNSGESLGWLTSAWRSVAECRPEARLWLVGLVPGSAGLPGPGAGVPGGVSAVGAFDDMETLLAAADVCLIAGTGADSRACLLEAMAAGRPIVASRSEALAEYIEHEKDGLLAAPGQPRDWAQALRQLVSDEKMGQRLAFAAQSRAVERFSVSLMVDSHLVLFERLLHAHEQVGATNRTDSSRS